MAKLDEKKLAEITGRNQEVVTKAQQAIADLDAATLRKDFGADAQQLVLAVEHHGKEVSRAINFWDEFIGPVVAAAHNTWKEAVKRREDVRGPLADKKNAAALAVGRWRRAEQIERERKEQEERDRLLKIEEDKRIAEAAELEKNGKKEQAEAVIDAPIAPPPVTYAAPERTKGAGLKTNWKFRVINPALIPRQYLMVDETAIGKMVRASEGKVQIPGVEVYPEEKATFSSR